MGAVVSARTRCSSVQSGREPRATTLLALVRSVAEVTEDDREVVATVLHLLRSGQVRLCGILRETPIDELD